MKRIAQQLGALVVLFFCSFSYSNAQVAGTEQTTNNLISNTWSGTVPYSGTGAGYSGGDTPGYNSSNNTLYFGYVPTTVAQTIAINQALQGSGIIVNGYNWSWTITNGNIGGTTSAPGSLSANINTYSSGGSLLHNFSQNYRGLINNQSFSGSQTYSSPYQAGTLGNLSVEFTGADGSFWAGYYGPQVSNVNVALRYSPDPCVVNPQSSPGCPGYKTYYTFGDDSYAHVPLPFSFPFYGKTFTNSWMHSNGVVSFLDPLSPIEGAANPGSWAYCCGGPDLSQNTIGYGAQFNYTIAPFWTDLYPDTNSQFYTTQSSTNINYHWNNVADISNGANRNSFSLELRSSGYIGATYGTITSQQQVTIGTIGDLRLNEKTHQFFGIPGAGTISNWSLNSTQAADCSSPLTNPYCPGYAEAYLSQQCTISALYSPQCPGYEQAFFTQQCTANPLYNINCPGYATAYYDYQCSIDPLYHTGCPGYDQAYFTQQCNVNPLYNINCSTYADAFYIQQCTANPLYDSGCTGYAEAYALKYVVTSPTSTPSGVTDTTVAVTTTDPVSSTSPIIADPIVNQAVVTTSTSTNPAQSATATVPLVSTPSPAVTTVVATTSSTKEEKKTETTSTSTSTTTTTTTASTDNKNEPKSNRQALAERRLEAARAKAVEEGKQLANKMGEAATMEAQVAVQNVVLQAMGFTPGFDAYGKVLLPDVAGYKPFEIYKGQRNIDNPLGRRLMTGSDRLHNEMVDMQYNR